MIAIIGKNIAHPLISFIAFQKANSIMAPIAYCPGTL